MTARPYDDTNDAKFLSGDSGAGNGAAGGVEAHDNLIKDVMLDPLGKGFSSAVKDQSAGVKKGVEDQLEVVVGNQPKAHELKASEIAEAKQPAGDRADMSKEALAFTMNDEAKRAAAGRGTLVFDNSIYPPVSDSARQVATDSLFTNVGKERDPSDLSHIGNKKSLAA